MPTIRNGHINGGGVGDIHFHHGRIVAEAQDDKNIDATGLIVSPGLIDIQINGAFGHDFTYDPTTIWEVGERLPEIGVTGFVPTIISSPRDLTDFALDVVANRRPAQYRGADVLGLHFEGPWISPVMHGAHNPDHLSDPDLDIARKWAESGLVRVVTLAPELPGALEVVEFLRGAGVVVSLGHTAAGFADAKMAYSAGATLATHLFNQMTPFNHREPGAAVAALLHADACLLIVDGIHLADATVELAWRVLGKGRTVLVTDAMAALGLGHGTYVLGDKTITVEDDGPRTEDGRLAGSVVTIPEAIFRMQSVSGATRPESLRCSSLNPAKAIRLRDRGFLETGTRADFALFNDDYEVVEVMSKGETVYSA